MITPGLISYRKEEKFMEKENSLNANGKRIKTWQEIEQKIEEEDKKDIRTLQIFAIGLISFLIAFPVGSIFISNLRSKHHPGIGLGVDYYPSTSNPRALVDKVINPVNTLPVDVFEIKPNGDHLLEISSFDERWSQLAW